jgi:hypothetical protein
MADLTLTLAMSFDCAVISMHENMRMSDSFKAISTRLGWKGRIWFGSSQPRWKVDPDTCELDRRSRMAARSQARLDVPARLVYVVPCGVSDERRILCQRI